MKPQAAETRREAQAWLDELSEAQWSAVAPVLRAISGLLTFSADKAALPREPANAAARSGADESFAVLEERLEKALATEDAQALREEISSCLEWARSERARLKTLPTNEETAGEIKAEMPHTRRAAVEDATTGLPSRLIFERTVANAMAESKESVVGLFVVERLAYVNKRFGRQAGDEVLLFVAQYLAQELADAKCLCKWSGPAFAVLLSSQNATRKAELQLRAIARKQLSHTIDSGGRSVMLPINCSCLVEVVSPETSPDELFLQMDQFLSAHANE